MPSYMGWPMFLIMNPSQKDFYGEYDDGAQSHNLQLKRSRYDETLDAECETIDPALAKYAEGEKSGDELPSHRQQF